MDNLKEFWNKYKGAIIGVVIAILILITRLHDLILAIVVLVLGAIVGNYVQQNKEDVLSKTKKIHFPYRIFTFINPLYPALYKSRCPL